MELARHVVVSIFDAHDHDIERRRLRLVDDQYLNHDPNMPRKSALHVQDKQVHMFANEKVIAIY